MPADGNAKAGSGSERRHHAGGDGKTSLRELALLFLRLGITGFGGPAAHIAMMQDEVVERRKWMTKEQFLDLYGATNLIPGPNSTEMAIHVGHHRAGWVGLVVAGTCFIVPAALITLGLAWAYTRFGALPEAGWLLYGVKPVIIGVVLQALWGLGQTAVRTKLLGTVATTCVVASALGVNELVILFATGVLVMAVHRVWKDEKPPGPPSHEPPTSSSSSSGSSSPPPPPSSSSASSSFLAAAPVTGAAGAVASAAAATPFGLLPLFLFFAKVGAVLFGSGYVLLAFLRADLVDRLHWLTEAQLLDAVAAGQVTPGPVFTTATFVGYVLGGTPGAIMATLGIFLPAFFFVAVSGPLVPRLRRSAAAGAFLDGVNVASLALMVVVTFQLGRAAVTDWITAALAVASAFLLVRYRLNSAWLVLGGAIAGLAAHLLR
jgi:chromate transporter